NRRKTSLASPKPSSSRTNASVGVEVHGTAATGPAAALASPFAALDPPPRQVSFGAGLHNRGDSMALSSMSNSLASEPSLPWADPGLLEDLRQASGVSSRISAHRKGSGTGSQFDDQRSDTQSITSTKSRTTSIRSSGRLGSLMHTMPSAERASSGTAPPPSPFGESDDENDEHINELLDEFASENFGGANGDRDGASRNDLNHQFSGLTSLSQSELQMVMQLTDEIKQEPQALNEALSALNLGIPAPSGSGSYQSLGACRSAVCQEKLDQTLNKLRAVLPPEMAQHLPPASVPPAERCQEIEALNRAAQAASDGKPPAFAEPVVSADLDKVAAGSASEE
ncbi:hypothetical protein WJX73_001606, partial [Symbiochloris irregularis]